MQLAGVIGRLKACFGRYSPAPDLLPGSIGTLGIQVVVIDFGLAKGFHDATQTCGTPGYMPPEVRGTLDSYVEDP